MTQDEVSHLQVRSAWVMGLLAGVYLAVLPMSGTIALRYLMLALLLLFVFWQFIQQRAMVVPPMAFIVWAAYLLVFPVLATDATVAWRSVGSQWGMGVLATIAGAGVARALATTRWGSSFHLGLFSCFTLLVHLVLSLQQMGLTSSIPWGYWGRETHHADLGYAAGQAVILLLAGVLASKKPWHTQIFVLLLLVACLASTALARSRAGFVFSVLGMVLVFATAALSRSKFNKALLFSALGGLFFVVALVFAVAVKNDVRWTYMQSNLAAGLLGDPLRIACEGTASVEAQIQSLYGTGERAQRAIASVKDGDGARVVLLRAGIQLVSQHPWGWDGSRQAYQKILHSQCANPAIVMAHTHNGWLDTALALGWVGAVAYFWLLLHCVYRGYQALHASTHVQEWALVLVGLGIFWIVRAATDSVMRDHMLQMQGFVLAYAYFSLRNTLQRASS